MAAGESYDGRGRLFVLDTPPADPAAITPTELSGGDDISDYVPPDGFDPGINNDRVAGGSVNSSFKSEAPGQHGAQPVATLKRKLSDSGATVAWDALGARNVACTLVWFEDIDEGQDPTTGDDYQCFVGCKTLEPETPGPASNSERVFKAQFAVGTAVVHGTVAA